MIFLSLRLYWERVLELVFNKNFTTNGMNDTNKNFTTNHTNGTNEEFKFVSVRVVCVVRVVRG